jgi:hypothetical protein
VSLYIQFHYTHRINERSQTAGGGNVTKDDILIVIASIMKTLPVSVTDALNDTLTKLMHQRRVAAKLSRRTTPIDAGASSSLSVDYLHSISKGLGGLSLQGLSNDHSKRSLDDIATNAPASAPATRSILNRPSSPLFSSASASAFGTRAVIATDTNNSRHSSSEEMPLPQHESQSQPLTQSHSHSQALTQKNGKTKRSEQPNGLPLESAKSPEQEALDASLRSAMLEDGFLELAADIMRNTVLNLMQEATYGEFNILAEPIKFMLKS